MTEDTVCKTADRCHVDALLKISEESFAEVCLCEMPVQSPWEQAVKGWNQCPPLACLFQLQNKCNVKPVNTGEHEFHCVLCMDANLAQKTEVDQSVHSESSETKCSLPEDTIDLETPQISPSENSCSDAERNSFECEKTTTVQAESSKVTERAKLHRLTHTLPKMTYMKLAMQCPIMKKKGIISKFSVLPPLISSGYLRGAKLRNAAASTLSSPDSLTAESRLYGSPLTGEIHVEGGGVSAGAKSGAEVPQDSHRSHTARCYQSTPSKQLLSAFSISLPTRCGSSLNSFEDTLAGAPDIVGRKIKNDTPIRGAVNNQGHNQRRTENELPTLLGTRVPIQAVSHRIVSTSNA